MTKLIITTFIGLIAFTQTVNASIPDDATEFNGHYYKVFEDGMSWSAAKDYCESIGGHLATITSSEENEKITQLISNKNKGHFWIGGYRDDQYKWYWITGEVFDYSNWNSGEPNNGLGMWIEDKAVIYSHNNVDRAPLGKWNDGNADGGIENYGFICEWDNAKSYVNSTGNIRTQKQVMHDFMKALAEDSYSKFFKTNNSAIENLDNAINKSSNGLFKSTDDLIEKFTSSLISARTNNIEDTLLTVCGIDFLNDDTGSITGLDTGNKEEKNYLSIVPEPEGTNYIRLENIKSKIPSDRFVAVKGVDNVGLKRNGIDLLMYFRNHGLTVKVDNYFGDVLSLNENEKIIVNGLYNWWIDGALNLIKESYDIGFNSPTSKTNHITIINHYHIVDAISNVLSPHSAYVNNLVIDTNLVMGISEKYYSKLDLSTKPGRNGLGKNMPNGVNKLHYLLDRETAHEFTHCIMKANIKGFNKLPTFLKEGMAELTIGADDKRKSSMLYLLNNYYNGGNFLQTALRKDSVSQETYDGYNDLQYAAGYMLMRYFAKQVSDANNVVPIFKNISIRIPSDALYYNGHHYKIIDEGMTWNQAKRYCESKGGHLATITSTGEQKFLADNVIDKGTRNNYWLGGYKENNTWKWITGESFKFTAWAYGLPDNAGGPEDFAMMYNGINPANPTNNLGEWNDIREDGICNGTQINEPFFRVHNFGLICEWEQ